MTYLRIQFPCSSCSNQPSLEPCRMCGGTGFLRAEVTTRQLERMPYIPEVLSATIKIVPRQRATRRSHNNHNHQPKERVA